MRSLKSDRLLGLRIVSGRQPLREPIENSMKHPKFILAMILLCIQLACRAPDGPAREDEGTRVPGCPVHAQPKTSLGFGWPDVVFNSEEMKLDREYGRTVKLSANVFLENGRVVVLLRNVGQGEGY